MARSRTIILSVSRKTGDVFDAILESPPKMMSDAKKNPDGSWSFSTPRGMANLKFKHNKALGILDHLYEDNETSWEVPMRVVASGNESEILITLVKPDILTNEQFDERMKEIEILFDNLKKIIEAS
jgi:hypothetical protein